MVVLLDDDDDDQMDDDSDVGIFYTLLYERKENTRLTLSKQYYDYTIRISLIIQHSGVVFSS